jgi:hypothetical protein
MKELILEKPVDSIKKKEGGGNGKEGRNSVVLAHGGKIPNSDSATGAQGY